MNSDPRVDGRHRVVEDCSLKLNGRHRPSARRVQARDDAVVLDAYNKHAPLGIGEADDIARQFRI